MLRPGGVIFRASFALQGLTQISEALSYGREKEAELNPITDLTVMTERKRIIVICSLSYSRLLS